MIEYWGEQGPPVHISVAAYMGLTGKKKKKPAPKKALPPGSDQKALPAPEPQGSDLNELVSMFRGRGGNF